MSAVINTNMAAIRTHGVYNRNNTEMNAAMTRVATAQKVNSVRDNASDWAISEKIRERVRSLNQANQNVQNDTAMMKTASGALGNTIDIIKTLKERAINAANDSNQDSDRTKIQAEVKQLLDQIDKNAEVKFNGKALIDGSASEKVDSATKEAKFGAFDISKTGAGLGATGNFDIKISWKDSAGDTQSVNMTGIDRDTSIKTKVEGATIPTGSGFSIVGTAADTDITGLTAEDGSTLKQSSSAGFVAIASTAGTAGAGKYSDLKIEISGGGATATTISLSTVLQTAKDANPNGSPLSFQYGDDTNSVMDITIANMDSTGLGLSGIDVSTKAGAKSAMTTIDSALATALEQQTNLGSIETRLGYTADNLSTQIENLEASDSAIRDADMAKEMTNYMKYAVLSQASQYMLAQAGQNAFQVLNLLQQ
ncbi:MAG: flagellin [Selenomonadaceae bacterium]|nr:flagellin [Selenomonadaceae bacterium]